jgi:predicted dienelactone hydrolase
MGCRTWYLPNRGRTLPCDVWCPIGRATPPLVLVSHFSGGHRRSSTFLCRHLASHGYAVVAIDHSEIVAPELAAQPDADQKARAAEAIIASRVPDLRLALDVLAGDAELAVDGSRVGLVGHSLGGWTALATPGRRAADRRRRSAGASRKLPPAAGYRTRAAAVHLEPRRTDIDPHRRRRRQDPAGRSQRGVLPDPVDEAPVRPGRC